MRIMDEPVDEHALFTHSGLDTESISKPRVREACVYVHARRRTTATSPVRQIVSQLSTARIRWM